MSTPEPAILSHRLLQKHGYSKPASRDSASYSPLAADMAYSQMMEQGSKALLRAIWRSHPIIMAHHAVAGRCVVRP